MTSQKHTSHLQFFKKSAPLVTTVFMLTACNQLEKVKSVFSGESEQAETKNESINASVDSNKINQPILNGGLVPSAKSDSKNASTTYSNKPENLLISDDTVKMFSAKKESKDKPISKNIKDNKPNLAKKIRLQPNMSQQFLGNTEIELRLIESLPEIPYSTEGLSDFAIKVNNITWSTKTPLDRATIIRIQALLNWHNHGVGAVDGKFSKNTIKAMQAFQESHGLAPTKTMTKITWDLLTINSQLVKQPVLVQYTLKKEDVRLTKQWGGLKNMQYRSIREQLAEKFHMTRSLLAHLNPKTRFKAGKVITVYNPGQPNTEPVHRVEIYKRKNLLVAFDDKDQVVASYPTTIGSKSPSGTYHVANRVIKPSYNSDFSKKKNTLPPGPNNPVGLVWMGLSKPSFGIHGSPKPELISRQRSHGCVRLTNWDALGLYGTMQKRAEVKFK